MNITVPPQLHNMLHKLKRIGPAIFGLALAGVFVYTSVVVNAALNVKPAASASSTTTPSKITFDKSAIDTLNNLYVVKSDVPTGQLGLDDPFQ